MGRWLYKKINYLFSSLIDIIYSDEKKCFICEKEIESDLPICNYCEKYLPYLEKEILPYENVILEKVYSIFRFEGKIKEIIYDIKYNKKIKNVEVIGDIMAEFIENRNINPDVIVPIPMHKDKIQERGYNHIELICKRIGKVTGIKISNSLKKEKFTSSQVLLSGDERWYNVEGSFKSLVSHRNKKILLIDDVVTSCATGHFSAVELGKENKISLLAFASTKKF